MVGVDDPATEAAVRAYVKLMRAGRCVLAHVERSLEPHGLTVNQLGVLEAILHKGPLGHRELRRKLLSSPGNMTDVLDKLERRGLVHRRIDPRDRRQIVVSLSAAGETLIRGLFPTHAADIAAAMASLDGEELAQLDRLLRKLGRGAQAGAGDALAPG